MPCSYVITDNGMLIVEKWSGKVTKEDFAEHKRELDGVPDIKQGAAVLSDCTQAEVEIDTEAVAELADMEAQQESVNHIRRYAFLVSDKAYPHAQLYAEKAKEAGKSVIVFNSIDVAATWLGADPDLVRDSLKRLS